MANVQSDVATKPRNRKWVRVGITSFGFTAAVVGAFYLGSQRNASPIGNAPQSSVTNATPANASQGTDDANAPVGAVRAPILSDIDTSGQGIDHDLVTIQPDGPDEKPMPGDRYADVMHNFASGDGEGMDDLKHQISDAAIVLQDKDLTSAERANVEDVVAAMIMFADAKIALPGKANAQIMQEFRSYPINRDAVARAIGRAMEHIARD